MDAERLKQLRMAAEEYGLLSSKAAIELLDHIEALTAELSKLRDDVNAKYWERVRDDNTKLRDRLRGEDERRRAELVDADRRTYQWQAAYQKLMGEVGKIVGDAMKFSTAPVFIVNDARHPVPAPDVARAKCGHVAYRNHDDLCIDDTCPHAAYVATPPSTAEPGARPFACRHCGRFDCLGANCRQPAPVVSEALVPCSVCGKPAPMPAAFRVYCGNECAEKSVAGTWRAP